jgi:SLT domain-containing protein
VIRARSSASGLGQLLLANVDEHYPDGRAGIGDPLNEAAGMLSYIKKRYGNPDEAWRMYGRYHEGY